MVRPMGTAASVAELALVQLWLDAQAFAQRVREAQEALEHRPVDALDHRTDALQCPHALKEISLELKQFLESTSFCVHGLRVVTLRAAS